MLSHVFPGPQLPVKAGHVVGVGAGGGVGVGTLPVILKKYMVRYELLSGMETWNILRELT